MVKFLSTPKERKQLKRKQKKSAKQSDGVAVLHTIFNGSTTTKVGKAKLKKKNSKRMHGCQYLLSIG